MTGATSGVDSKKVCICNREEDARYKVYSFEKGTSAQGIFLVMCVCFVVWVSC